MSESYKTEIKSSFGTYTVSIGNGLARRLVEQKNSIVLTDANLLKPFPWLYGSRTIELQALESAKNLESVAFVIESLRERGANRGSDLIAVGGGIIQDVATMSASLYMRGIPWIYCPTTLLGMVDSCIGGKSSINVGKYKNIAGNFFPPTRIYIDTELCDTLPLTQRIAGLCEAVKICFADTEGAFEKYLDLVDGVNILVDSERLSAIVALSIETKKRFIEEDEFDNGIRLLLNFGHTFGHALEAASDFKISHGVAVGLGMIAAYIFSLDENPNLVVNHRVGTLLKHVRWLINQVPDINYDLHNIDRNIALNKFKSDKKHKHNEFAVISYNSNGFLQRQFLPINIATEKRLLYAFDNIKNYLS